MQVLQGGGWCFGMISTVNIVPSRVQNVCININIIINMITLLLWLLSCYSCALAACDQKLPTFTNGFDSNIAGKIC